MFRRIVGWVRISDKPWAATMDRMNQRMQRAMEQWPVKIWSNRIAGAKWEYSRRLKSMERSKWPVLACEWIPNLVLDLEVNIRSKRNCGHPLLRWDDFVNSFCMTTVGSSWQDVPSGDWLQHLKGFSPYCNHF